MIFSTKVTSYGSGGVTIMVRTPALCLLETSDKSFSLCLPYSSFTLCLICTDNLISLLIPSLVRHPCSTYDSFLVTNTVVPCSLFSTSPCTYKYIMHVLSTSNLKFDLAVL